MSKHDCESAPEPTPTPPAQCEGWSCRETRDVRYDPTSRKFLCVVCWAKVDPSNHGYTRYRPKGEG